MPRTPDVVINIERRGNRPTLEQVVKLCVEVYGNPRFLTLCGYSEEEALRMMEEYRRKKHAE